MTLTVFNRATPRPMTREDYAELGIDDPNDLWDQMRRELDAAPLPCDDCGDETGECGCAESG